MFGRFGFSSKAKSTVEPVEAPESVDRYYREAWGLSALEWAGKTEEQRRDYRERVSYAVANFGKVK